MVFLFVLDRKYSIITFGLVEWRIATNNKTFFKLFRERLDTKNSKKSQNQRSLFSLRNIFAHIIEKKVFLISCYDPVLY